MNHASTPPACADDRHRARTILARVDQDILRCTCRRCGCALVRTRATRVWIRSGELG